MICYCVVFFNFMSLSIFYNCTCIVLSNHLLDPFMLHPCPVTIWVNISWWLTPSSLRLWIDRSRQTINKQVSTRERFSLLDVFSIKNNNRIFWRFGVWEYNDFICTIMKVRQLLHIPLISFCLFMAQVDRTSEVRIWTRWFIGFILILVFISVFIWWSPFCNSSTDSHIPSIFTYIRYI